MSGPKVEVLSREFEAMKGKSKGGNDYDFARQDAYMHVGGQYPDKFQVPLEKDSKGNYVPYDPGWYEFAPESYVVRDGRPAIDAYNVQLVKSDAPAKVVSKAA